MPDVISLCLPAFYVPIKTTECSVTAPPLRPRIIETIVAMMVNHVVTMVTILVQGSAMMVTIMADSIRPIQVVERSLNPKPQTNPSSGLV